MATRKKKKQSTVHAPFGLTESEWAEKVAAKEWKELGITRLEFWKMIDATNRLPEPDPDPLLDSIIALYGEA